MLTERVREILSWYDYEIPGVRANLVRMLNHGQLAGTGRMVVLPVDQGWEHGPARSFAPNPGGYDPVYHFELAIEAGCNAHAAPLGAIEAGADRYAGVLPLILKLNSHDLLHDEDEPIPAMTASVDDALRLGAAAIGFTIYPGSAFRADMYRQLRDIVAEARSKGLPSVVWSYPRGGDLDKKAETALDVVAYAAHIAAQLGAHIIKVKPPSDHLAQDAARKVYEKQEVPRETLAQRIEHVIRAAFNGKRIVLFSGGAAKGADEVFEEVRQLKQGGAFGSIIGRNSFQRPKADALAFLQRVIDIYKS